MSHSFQCTSGMVDMATKQRKRKNKMEADRDLNADDAGALFKWTIWSCWLQAKNTLGSVLSLLSLNEKLNQYSSFFTFSFVCTTGVRNACFPPVTCLPRLSCSRVLMSSRLFIFLHFFNFWPRSFLYHSLIPLLHSSTSISQLSAHFSISNVLPFSPPLLHPSHHFFFCTEEKKLKLYS